MEELEKTEASRGVSDSGVTVGDHVVDENLVDSEVSVSQGQVEGSYSEEVERVEGGDEDCNGDDIMVEVLGSDVYVDGVCTNKTAGNLDDVDDIGSDGSSCNEIGMERDEMSLAGYSGAMDEPLLEVSGGIANGGVHNTLREVPMVEEPIDAVPQEIDEDADKADDAIVLDNEVQPDNSSIVACPIDKETESIHMDKEDFASKGAMDVVEVSQVGSDQVGLFHKSSDVKILNTEEAEKAEVHPEKSDGFSADNGFEDVLVNAGGVGKLVTEEAATTDGGGLIEGLGQVSVEDGKQFDDPGVDGNSNLQVHDASEKTPQMSGEKDLNPEVILCSGGLEGHKRCIVIDHEDKGKSDRIDDQSEVADGRELASNILTDGQKVIGVRELSYENLDLTMAVSENVASSNSVPSNQSNQMNTEANIATENDGTIFTPNIEVSAENEQSLNVPAESMNISMNFEQSKNVVNDSTLADFDNVEEMEVEQSNNVNEECLHDEEESEDVADIEGDDDQIVKCATPDPESFTRIQRAHYQLPLENDGDFSISDLVWGKVRSHPWWPGQIFDPSDASEKAMKYYKKDFCLVAYFGDRTFAWNEVSHLKPFRTHFSEEEIQRNSEAFQNAVECALEEVSRRSELGLACGCTPKEEYDLIECQIIENAGIREESSRRYGVDKSANARSFEPAKLIEYIRDLAKFPSDGSERLELVIAKAQLTAFYRLKGYCSLPVFQFCGLPPFQFCGGLVDNDSDNLETEVQSIDIIQHGARPVDDAHTHTLSYQENLKSQTSSYHKRKHNLKDGLYPKKEKSLSEIMGDTFDNLEGENWYDGKSTTTLASPSAKKRKTVEYPADDLSTPDGRKTMSLAKFPSTAPLKQSFKIGDCIRRVASQMTGTPPIVKSNVDRVQKTDSSFDGQAGYASDILLQNFDDAQRGRMNLPTDYSSLDELLSQLQLVAGDPMKEYSFLHVIVSFFTDFRDSIVSRQHSGVEELATDKASGKRKTPFTSIVASPETFEFEDMSDTYWTDRVIQNGTEVQQPRRSRKRDYQRAVPEPEKSIQGSRRPYKKRNSVVNNAATVEKFTGCVNEPSSAQLVMNFSEVDSVPSEKTLNNMFRRFGPLRESETEVDREGGRARVVFKKSSDAEIAFNSAGTFNIFGPRLVNYQLSYNLSTLFKTSPIPRIQDQEMHLDLSSTQFQEMQLDLTSFHDHEMQLDLSSIHDQEMHLDLSAIGYQEMESVLGPNQDQQNKPSYTSTQLGELQADFSTIQYERQPDLASTHDQELQSVFVSNQDETQSVPAEALPHNFTSTQIAEVQVDHALSHQDEPPVLASVQGQDGVQPFFATIKEEKIQPLLPPLEEETQVVFTTFQEHKTQTVATNQLVQDDLSTMHHEEQIVPAVTQEQEMREILDMSQEERHPICATIQEQEKGADISPPGHHGDMQPVPSPNQDHERQPETISDDLMGEPTAAMTEGQEMQQQHMDGTMGEHETHVGAIERQELQLVGGALEGQEINGDGEIEGQETQVDGAIEGQETQVDGAIKGQEPRFGDVTMEKQEILVGAVEGQETYVVGAIEGQETHVDPAIEGQETHVDRVIEGQTHVDGAIDGQETHVDRAIEGQETHVDGAIEGQETHVDGAIEGQETHVDGAIEGQEPQLCDSAMERQEMQLVDGGQETHVNGAIEGQEPQPRDSAMERQEIQLVDGAVEGQETHVDGAIEGQETHVDGGIEGQEPELRDGAMERQEIQLVDGAVEGQEKHVDGAIEGQETHVDGAIEGQEPQLCDGAMERQEIQLVDCAIEGQDTHVGGAIEGQDTHVGGAIEGQEPQLCDCAMERQEIQLVDGAVEGLETHVDGAIEGQDTHVDVATEGQVTHVDGATEGQGTHVSAMEEQVMEHVLDTTEQTTQSVTVASHEQEDKQLRL